MGAGPAPPGTLLRLEGDPETTFSGICSVGAREESVLSGRVPKRFAFDPNGRRPSCRIQKRGTDGGELKVVLTDDTVRSVQQIKSPRGVINISYSG